jgi:hypothetical protein
MALTPLRPLACSGVLIPNVLVPKVSVQLAS